MDLSMGGMVTSGADKMRAEGTPVPAHGSPESDGELDRPVVEALYSSAKLGAEQRRELPMTQH